MITGERREGSSRNMYKGPVDKAKGEMERGWEVGRWGGGKSWWEN